MPSIFLPTLEKGVSFCETGYGQSKGIKMPLNESTGPVEMMCKECGNFALYWDSDRETEESCDKAKVPNNCSKWLCNDTMSGCPLLVLQYLCG